MGLISSKLKKRRREQDFYLQITSLIDTLVIILIFMLKSFTSSAVNLDKIKNLNMPEVKAGSEEGQGAKISVSKNFIMLDNARIALLPLEAKNVKENGRLIVPLYAELLKQSESSKAIALKKGVKFEGTIILQSDKDASFTLVKKILYTAGRAGYNDIKFAAVKL